jgi:hypothetical protein
MLDFFRQYQRYFFFVITVVVIASFIFFGTYSTLGEGGGERKDVTIGHAIDGSEMRLSEVQKLSYFLASDQDGLVGSDLLKTRIAHLLAQEYFEAMKGDLELKLQKIKRFKSYVHPEAPFLSAKGVWDHFLPEMAPQIEALQKEKAATPDLFEKLSSLYLCQARLHPEVLRRILIHQHQQYPWLTVDQRLSHEDLSLFGFHTPADWFGKTFIDLAAQFILNGAAIAESKGYTVSMEEAKGDLLRQGLEERTAPEIWRKVLLFRKYFQDVGGAAFVDTLPYKDFAEFAKEVAVVQKYSWPIRLKNGQDLAAFKLYVDTVCKKGKTLLPTEFLSVEEVEKKNPELVATVYKAKVAEVNRKEVALKPTMKEVWEWQMSHWPQLKKKFSLADAEGRENRFALLEQLSPKQRGEIDAFTRQCLVDENPTWIEEALAQAPLVEKSWSVSGKEEPTLKKEGFSFRIEQLEVIEPKHILTFEKARPFLKPEKGEYADQKNPFFLAASEALKVLSQNPEDSQWVQSGTDPLRDQFKLERRQIEVTRNSGEDWMHEQPFFMMPNLWSPAHVAGNGEVEFFYLQERKTESAPILEQLTLGKETLSADAKLFVAERLLQKIRSKNAIQIPLQGEE